MFVHPPLLSCYGSAHGGSMCDMCEDIVRVTEWTQLTLDDSHELWFKVSECLCGIQSTDMEMRVTVTNG